jgi:hypothetical protein
MLPLGGTIATIFPQNAPLHNSRKKRTPIVRSFAGLDRTEAASDRAAVALEGIAELLEQAHAALRQRLAGPAAPEPLPVLPEQEPAPTRNGRKRIAST